MAIKEIDKPLAMALNYLSYQPRTVHEMQTYMKKKGVNENLIGKIIEILLANHYLDDTSFAKLFVETRVRHKAKSKFAFHYELKKKGICSSIIDAALSPYEDTDLAMKAIRPKIKTWQQLDRPTLKKKMMNFLRYRGFDYEVCLSTLDQFIESMD